MIRRPPRSTRTDTLFPFSSLFRSVACVVDHHGSFNLFVEMTEVLPFSQDVATILGDAIAELRKRGLRKVAHISPSTLAQIQIRRISQRHEDSRIFSDHVAAMRWLSDGEHSALRSEEHTSELQSLMRISYAVFCLK